MNPEGFNDFETDVGDVVGGEWRDENIGESVFKSLPKSDTRNAQKNAHVLKYINRIIETCYYRVG